MFNFGLIKDRQDKGFLDNEWDDTSATGATGWTYNGDGTWTGNNVSNQDIYINNLGTIGSTYRFRFEIISRTAGTVTPKLRGTVGSYVSTVGIHEIDVSNDLGYAHTGLNGSGGFTGVVRIIAVKKREVVVPYCAGTAYFVSTGPEADDANDGLSPDSPWETLTNVNGGSFDPGDSIFFKRGHTWEERLVPPNSGDATGVITFGAYDTGDKPVFDGTNYTFTPGTDMYLGFVHVAYKKYITIEDLRVQHVGDISNLATDDGNDNDNTNDPAAGNENSAINVIGNTTEYITVKNCETWKSEAHGIRMHNGVANCSILNNVVELACICSKSECITISNSHDIEVSWNVVKNNGNYGLGTGGTGIDSKNGSYNVSIHHNDVSDIHGNNGIYADAYDSDTEGIHIWCNYIHDTQGPGITIGSEGTGDLIGILVNHNKVVNAQKSGFQIHNAASNPDAPDYHGYVMNPEVYNNTFVSCGLSQANDVGGAKIYDPLLIGLLLKNNIFIDCENFQIGNSSSGPSDDEITSEYNVINGDQNSVGVYHPISDDTDITEETTLDTNMKPLYGSSAIDAGDPSVFSGHINIVSFNNVQITDGSGNVLVSTINCGAYE